MSRDLFVKEKAYCGEMRRGIVEPSDGWVNVSGLISFLSLFLHGAHRFSQGCAISVAGKSTTYLCS